jgi:hypothetical protein
MILGAALVRSILVPLNNVRASQPEGIEKLHRRAAAYRWRERLGSQAPKGEFAMSYDQIGEAAGAVWEALAKQGPLTFAALMEEINVPQSIFFMAIGWLSREQKLQFEPANGDYLVLLR